MKELYKKWIFELVVVYLILIIALVGFYYTKPIITGFLITSKQSSYSDNLNLVLNETGDYTWILDNPGGLKAVKLSGTLENRGSAKVYIENEGVKYLIFDSNKLDEKSILDKVTGFVAGQDKKDNSNSLPVWDSNVNNFIVDETLTINLDDYFNDKDNNILTYSISELRTYDLRILLINEILTISNINNLEGNRTLGIIASDGKTTKKKNIVLILKKKINKTVETPINEIPENITNKSIQINLEYKVGTNYDVDDNGIETTTGVIDFTVENTKFNWHVNKSKLCTRWETYSVENEESTIVCYGNKNCCNFVNLGPTRAKWSETFYSYYGLYGATSNNVILPQVLYIDYNLSFEKPYADIVFSSWEDLSAIYYTGLLKFDNICIDSCTLFDLNETSYKLIFEINNTILNINTIDYIIEKEVDYFQ